MPAKHSDLVPLFGDCAIPVGWPKHTNTPPVNLVTPVPTQGSGGTDDYLGMRIFCMALHGRAINIVFLDGHARTVPLEELWQLKWNSQFVPAYVTLPAK